MKEQDSNVDDENDTGPMQGKRRRISRLKYIHPRFDAAPSQPVQDAEGFTLVQNKEKRKMALPGSKEQLQQERDKSAMPPPSSTKPKNCY
eukprot:6462741-Amphidinium_carterae.2